MIPIGIGVTCAATMRAQGWTRTSPSERVEDRVAAATRAKIVAMSTLALVRALVDLAYFLDVADGDAVDADLAVAQLEQMAATLHAMTLEEKTGLRSDLLRIADSEEQSGRSERARFCRAFMETSGIE